MTNTVLKINQPSNYILLSFFIFACLVTPSKLRHMPILRIGAISSITSFCGIIKHKGASLIAPYCQAS